jgi:outer membrane cobalamin receptor
MFRRVVVFLFVAVIATYASILGGARILVHDPQHRSVPHARVTLHNVSSGVELSAESDNRGIAQFTSLPIGEYEVRIVADGFSLSTFNVTIVSDRMEEIHAPLTIAAANQSVNVVGSAADIYTSASTPVTPISRTEIAQTPGADRTNSLVAITDYVPGATIVHDQLHVRGGHQVTWAIDGVPVPNTNIASNVGPQFDPKDVEFIEAQRGSFSADYGDRTYGVFNVAPRSGFERSRLAELTLGYGSFNQTDNQLSFGDHSSTFAYYVSANGNRTDYGLEPPTPANLHNQAAGGGVFTSLTYNSKRGDQLRFAGAARGDFYQVPNDPDAQSLGVDDHQREQDAFASLTWLHSFTASTLLSITPFYHFNRAAFEGSAAEMPSATDNRSSSYAGGQASLGFTSAHHNARIGFYGFSQRDNSFLRLDANDGSGLSFSQRLKPSGNLEAVFLEDQFHPISWFTITAGVRATRFSADIHETATDPRIGAALTIPRVRAVLRASYSRFYQAPPLSTVSGPLLEFALQQGVDFLPLRGERDEQRDFGITLPFRAWTFDFDNFRTNARNFFDHDALGNSNIFLPLTIDHVLIRGNEVSVRSPKLGGRANVHLAYSRQSVVGSGAVTGGLTDFEPPAEAFYLDHDQLDTLSTGVDISLPWRSWTSMNVAYGSGFLNGDGPSHLPSYATFDLAVGKSFGEKWSARFTALNLTNDRHYIDLTNTFGGSHYSDPRMFTVQVVYRFHY